jgi:hypothetical protein
MDYLLYSANNYVVGLFFSTCNDLECSLTLLQLRTLCLDWLDDSAGTYFTASVLNLRLNLAQQELQKRLISANKEYYLKCVKTSTVAAQQPYALPTDFYQVVRLEWYETGTALTTMSNKIQPMTPNQRDLMGAVTADPEYFSFAKNNLMLWPIPNRIVEMHLEYSYLVTDMSADGDEPDAPEQFHEYIAVLATRDCLIKDGRPLQPIESKMAHYEELLKQIAVQRDASAPRMIIQSGSEYGW